MKYLHCLIGHNVLYFQFRPTLLTNVWNLKQFSAKNLIILVNFGLKSAIFNLVSGPVHVIWAEVISVTEKTFRQVYKRDLALLWNNKKSCIAFIWDEKFHRPGTEISLADRRDLGDQDNFYPIWTQLSRLAENFLFTLYKIYITAGNFTQ